jgi:hypothetical protein
VVWPGWARSGRDEAAAVATLFAYGPRYAKALRGTRLGFELPASVAALDVVERLAGNATTDFGAPDIPPSTDLEAVDEGELRRLAGILRACWRTFDRAAATAEGKELTKGPRGGGRDLAKIVDHVLDADESYLRMLGRKVSSVEGDASERTERLRAAVLDGIEVAVRDGVPLSPRGGKRWTPRYFVRRSAWHVLDHAWELQDRTAPPR